MTPAPKASARKRTSPAPSELRLAWSLAELPSSQHRAGLAGLVLMVRWLERQPRERPGRCELTRVDARGCELLLDLRGLEELFDEVYGATLEEIAVETPYKKKGDIVPPLRTELRPADPNKPKSKAKELYVYPRVVPKGAFLLDLDPTREGPSGLWVKLWRDLVWSTLRGIPAQRAPFNARANGEPTSDAGDAWAALADPDNPGVELPSTYYIGAQQFTAELVPFRDRARTQFLLHFAPFAHQVYVPTVTDADGQRSFIGYALGIPDVADLELFCELFEATMRDRDPRAQGFHPGGAVVDLAVEGGLEFLGRLAARLAEREGERNLGDAVLGVDVVHLEKEGNSVRLRGSARVDPEQPLVDAYRRVRDGYWDPQFRRTRLLNLVAGRPWYAGFDRLAGTLPASRIFASKYFRRDAREAFETLEQGESSDE